MPTSNTVALPSDEQGREFEDRYVSERETRLQSRVQVRLFAGSPLEAVQPEQALVAKEMEMRLDLVRMFDRHDVLYKNFPQKDDVIICEGDSWFNHPGLTTIPDWLDGQLGYSVLHSNCPGKLLSTSASEEHFMAPLRDSRKPQVKALLLSGGGNDVINWNKNGAAYSPIFKPASSTDPDAFINQPQLDAAVEAMVGCLNQIAHLLANAQVPDLPVLLHCYDHIIPHQYNSSLLKGTWVKPQLDALGATDPTLQSAITQKLQTYWMNVYRHTCGRLGWTYVDLQGCVEPGGWYDEIHPHSNGFYAAALRFQVTLNNHGVNPSRKIEQLAA